MIAVLLGVGWKLDEVRQITTAELIATYRSIISRQAENELNIYRASSYAQATEEKARKQYVDEIERVKNG